MWARSVSYDGLYRAICSFQPEEADLRTGVRHVSGHGAGTVMLNHIRYRVALGGAEVVVRDIVVLERVPAPSNDYAVAAVGLTVRSVRTTKLVEGDICITC